MSKIFWLTVLSLGILLAGCVQQDKVTVTVKQIIPLPTGTIIDISMPLNLSQGLDSVLPRTGDNTINENSSFVLPIEVVNGDVDFSNTTIVLFYEPEYVDFIYPYSWSKKPLQRLGTGTYAFDNDLKATQTTKLILAGRVKTLPSGLVDAGVRFNLTVYDDKGNAIGRASDIIRIKKVQGG